MKKLHQINEEQLIKLAPKAERELECVGFLTKKYMPLIDNDKSLNDFFINNIYMYQDLNSYYKTFGMGKEEASYSSLKQVQKSIHELVYH